MRLLGAAFLVLSFGSSVGLAAGSKCPTLLAPINVVLSKAEAAQISTDGIHPLEAPTSVKVRAMTNTWSDHVTMSEAHPPAFSYAVDGALDEEAVKKVLIAAMQTDKTVREEAVKISLEVTPLDSADEVRAATNKLYTLDSMDPDKHLADQAVRVFQNRKKRSVYRGLAAVDFGSIGWDAEFFLVVDGEKNEISVISFGDLFKAFVKPMPEE